MDTDTCLTGPKLRSARQSPALGHWLHDRWPGARRTARPVRCAGSAVRHLYPRPFCATRCGLPAPFTRPPSSAAPADRWLAALRAELALAAGRLGTPPDVQTVFVGGGTPSVLGSTPDWRRCSTRFATTSPWPRVPRSPRSQPRIDIARVFRPDPGRRLHTGVTGHAVGGPARTGRAGPGALAGPCSGGRAGSPRCRVRPRQHRSDLRDAGESDDDLRRSVDAALDADVDHVSDRGGGRGRYRGSRDGCGAARSAPDDDVLAQRYDFDGRLSQAGFDWYESPTGPVRRRVSAQPRLLGWRRMVGRGGQGRTATSPRPVGGMSSIPMPMRKHWRMDCCRWPTSRRSTPMPSTPKR